MCLGMSKVVIPRSVVIAGHRIRIRIVDGRELDGVYGDWSGERKEIRLARGEDLMVATLRHEMMHAALDLSGVGWCKRYQEEAIVRCMDEIFWPAWERLGL